MARITERWNFRVKQGGVVVAEGDAENQADAMREALHYCAVYGQDGSCTAVVEQVDDEFEPPTVNGEIV